jgi:branched-chain amino acid transport system substrate-binding protein
MDVVKVYRAWANTVNATGGINNHPVQLLVQDDGQNPGTSVVAAQTLVGDHVVAIADTSNVDESWATVAQKANIPVVGLKPTNVPFGSNPDFYPEGQTVLSSYRANLEIAKAAGAANIGLLYCTESASCAELVPLFKSVGQKVGLPIAYTGAISATAPNYTAQCVAAQQAHVQAFFIGHAPAVVARVGADCARQGYKPMYVTSGEVFNGTLLKAPGLTDNNWLEYVTHPYWDSAAPEVQAMNAAVDKYYPGLRSDTTNFTQVAAEAWPSGLLLADAVKAGNIGPTDAPTAAAIVRGLESLKGDTLQGWAPPLTFTAGQPHLITCWFTAHVQNGVPTLSKNGQVTCENGSS